MEWDGEFKNAGDDSGACVRLPKPGVSGGHVVNAVAVREFRSYSARPAFRPSDDLPGISLYASACTMAEWPVGMRLLEAAQ